jgi:hypothetical protein
MNAKQREEAIESLARSLRNVWVALLSDGLNNKESPETLRLTIMEGAKQLGIRKEVYERASEMMRGEHADRTVHSE